MKVGWKKKWPKIMNLIVEIKSFNHEMIKNFYHEIEKQGVWYAEEMLLPFEEAFTYLRNLAILIEPNFGLT